MTQAKMEELVRSNMGLVYGALHRFCVQPTEDNVADFTYYLVLAARAFDESRGFQFSTFAYRSMWNNHQAKQRKDKQWVTRNARLAAENSERELKLQGSRSARHDMDLEIDMSLLTEKERFVVALRADGKTLQEISELLGVCKERVRQVQLAAAVKMGLLAA